MVARTSASPPTLCQMSRRSGGSRRRLVWLAAVLVVLGATAVAVVALVTKRPGNVSNPDVEFSATPPSVPTTQPTPRSTKNPFDDGFQWPMYGFTKNRSRYLPLRRNLEPPFVQRWRLGGKVLLEFPPVICGPYLYLLKDNGALYSIRRADGRVRWKQKLGTLAAASPACGHGTVYVPLLHRGRGIDAGRVVALATNSGRTRWSQKLPSRSESSPLLDHDRLYFGTENGTVYALRAHDGATVWTYRARGAVKGGLALDEGRLYFGDYHGEVTALRRADGRRLWRTGTSGGAFGLTSGNFYATPAVAYDRVYLGNTDGFVYSFGASSGRLAWRHKTGGYVYGSTAVSDTLGGTVYASSYDGKLYALNARTGGVRWTHNAHGRLSGGPVVIGNLVFYSNLGRRSTGALSATTGQLRWSVGYGAFNPVISDGTRLYLNGYSALYLYTQRGHTTAGNVTKAERARRSARYQATIKRRRTRYLNARIAQRRNAVRRILQARRAGRRLCFRVGGQTTCRIPRPPVCFESASGRTICRTRKEQ
jgi:outer membrane protein assembly factor BamB